MTGYKAFNQDMTSKFHGIKFEMNKTYYIDEEPIANEKGFNFFKEIRHIAEFCTIAESRIFEVEVGEKIIEVGNRYVSNELTLIRELSKEEIHRYFSEPTVIKEIIDDNSFYEKRALIDQGILLDILINDKDEFIREAVANKGYGLFRLINDKSPMVRAAVAKQGIGLNILINDKEPEVREAVAKKGYGLERLINDREWFVRLAVAECGYGLNQLVHDESKTVRMVAESKLRRLSK